MVSSRWQHHSLLLHLGLLEVPVLNLIWKPPWFGRHWFKVRVMTKRDKCWRDEPSKKFQAISSSIRQGKVQHWWVVTWRKPSIVQKSVSSVPCSRVAPIERSSVQMSDSASRKGLQVEQKDKGWETSGSLNSSWCNPAGCPVSIHVLPANTCECSTFQMKHEMKKK